MSKSFNCLAQSNGIADTVTHLMSDAIISKGSTPIDSGSRGVTTYILDNGDTIPVIVCPGYTDLNKDFFKWSEPYEKYQTKYSHYIGVGIFGTIKHPGIELNYSIADKVQWKEKKDKIKIKVRRWELFTRYYYHRNFHHNVMLTAGRSWQRKLKKERFFISQADAGIARTFYDRPSFKVENGIVKRMWLAGDFYFNFNYRLGFGKHFHTKKETYRVYSYLGLMNFFPYNNLYYSRIYVGINLNKFIKK